MDAIVWILGLLNLTTLGAIWFFRTWLTAEIERRVQHKFDRDLESLRSELRMNEGQLAVLRDRLLGSRANRQALLDKRRMEAVEGLVAGIAALAPFADATQMLAPLNLEALEAEGAKDARVNTAIAVFTKNLPDLASYDRNIARKERIFVSGLAWAYFAAYEATVTIFVSRANLLKIGLEDGAKLLNLDSLKQLVKAALPEIADTVDGLQTVGAFAALVQILEKRLLAELDKNLKGEEQDQADTDRALAIMDRLSKMARP